MKNYGFLTPYMINKTQDGYFIRDCNGFVKNAKELIYKIENMEVVEHGSNKS